MKCQLRSDLCAVKFVRNIKIMVLLPLYVALGRYVEYLFWYNLMYSIKMDEELTTIMLLLKT